MTNTFPSRLTLPHCIATVATCINISAFQHSLLFGNTLYEIFQLGRLSRTQGYFLRSRCSSPLLPHLYTMIRKS